MAGRGGKEGKEGKGTGYMVWYGMDGWIDG